MAESFRDDLVACLDLNRLFCYADLSGQICRPDARPIDYAPVLVLVDDGDVLQPWCNRGWIPWWTFLDTDHDGCSWPAPCHANPKMEIPLEMVSLELHWT